MIAETTFLGRFERLWAALRRHQAGMGLLGVALVSAVALGLLAWADYRLELPRNLRAIGLAAAAVAALAGLGSWVVAPLRWWTRPRTAVEIERRFPQLGQRIRTVVQYAGLPPDSIVSEGATPSLVEALEDDTEAAVEPLPLDRVLPRGRLAALAALAATPLVVLAILAAGDPEWRTALQRTVLIERPYTTLAVRPGDVLIDQGASVPITAEVRGRARRRVTLETRPANLPDAEWKATRLPENKGTPERTTTLEKIKDPVEYRVLAGPASSPSFTIDVRYPLALKRFEVTLSPPEYTALKPETVPGGDLQAVEGTGATFALTFDTPPDEAALELTDPRRDAHGNIAPPMLLALQRQGDSFVAGMVLEKDFRYRILARTSDGRQMPKKDYKVVVREDRAPRVGFEEPPEALEVHPIAEVRHRVRVGDDFGLTRAGIVFQLGDGEERELLVEDFSVGDDGKPRTSAILDAMLLLEELDLSPRESVTYYAFAEDNFPGRPRRTESDLRYIDIRSFKREYKLAEPGVPGDSQQFTTLEELIARQRFNLNRANRLARHRPGDRTAAEDPLKIATFEELLMNLTREVTEGVEGIVGQPVDELQQALAAMTASLDSLDNGRFPEAPPAMAEALKHLVSARRELITLIGENPAAAAALRGFDRKQAQKIRKPKGEDQEAEELAAEIEELAGDEDFLYATLAAAMEGTTPNNTPTPSEATPSEPQEPEDPEGDQPKEASKAKGGQGSQGSGGKGQMPGEPSDRQGDPKEGDRGDNQSGEPRPFDRRAAIEKQEDIAYDARSLEERLRRIEAASDLAKARMARAAERAEKAGGALARGDTDEAADQAKAGAGMLHEVARQVRGEIAREATDQLAMARDLAQELAQRENDLAEMAESSAPGQNGQQPGREGEGQQPGSEGRGDQPGMGRGDRGGFGGWGAATEEERVQRLLEAARTLQQWLDQIARGEVGRASDAVREMTESGAIDEIVERHDRLGELRLGGRRPEMAAEARDLARRLEMVGQSLEMIHRGLVAPELAELVEFDRRLAELTGRLGTLRTDAEITAWHRDAAALIRDLEAAGIAGADELAEVLRANGWTGAAVGDWHWGGTADARVAPTAYTSALQAVSTQIKDRVQELMLKDLASARDEATPPAFRELVERYYEVLSRGRSK